MIFVTHDLPVPVGASGTVLQMPGPTPAPL